MHTVYRFNPIYIYDNISDLHWRAMHHMLPASSFHFFKLHQTEQSQPFSSSQGVASPTRSEVERLGAWLPRAIHDAGPRGEGHDTVHSSEAAEAEVKVEVARSRSKIEVSEAAYSTEDWTIVTILCCQVAFDLEHQSPSRCIAISVQQKVGFYSWFLFALVGMDTFASDAVPLKYLWFLMSASPPPLYKNITHFTSSIKKYCCFHFTSIHFPSC